MLPQPYTFSKARKLLSRFIQAKSDGIPHSVRTRTVSRAGQEIVENYAVRGRAICDGAEKTIWAVYRMAINQLEQLRRSPLLELEDYCVSNVPPVATNCKELCRAAARGMEVSDRTVRSHIKAGLELGIFTRKKFRGTKANFYVWINPEFLFATSGEADFEGAHADSKSAPEASGATEIGTNFPLNKLLPSIQKKETTTTNVDKLVTHEATTGGRLVNKREEEGEGKKQGTGGAGAAAVAPTAGQASAGKGGEPVGPLSAKKAGLSAEQTAMIEEFTTVAWREIYSPRGVTFNDQEVREFKNAVWRGVYGRFQDNWPAREWRRYHEQALERIGLAAGYFARNTDKWPSKPYAEHKPGMGYFDADNQNGFVKTFAWHQINATNRWNRKVAEYLRSARREWRQHLLGKAPKRVQQRSPLEVFRYWENKLKELGSNALHRFYANFQHPATPLSKAPLV